MIRREVTLTQKVKPVVISMGTVAASGGYWIAANADRIFASSNTLTGSIGIYGLIPNVKELANQHGVTWDSVKTGKFADALSYSRPKTDEEMAILQKYIDQGYDKFVDLVATGRKLSREAVQRNRPGQGVGGARRLAPRVGG